MICDCNSWHDICNNLYGTKRLFVKYEVDMEGAIYKDYIRQITQYPLFSFEEEIEHSKLIQKGDENAKRELVQANLRLVVSIAKKYENQYASVMDLIQEGNIGLLTAAGKYHYSYNVRFSTYAYPWIVQAISRYIKGRCSIISLPNRKEDELRRIKAARQALFQNLGREPSDDEIAKRLSITVEEVREINDLAYQIVSMADEKDGESGQSMENTIADTHMTPEQEYMADEDRQEIMSVIQSLPEMERRVVFGRYNFHYDEKVKTLRQLGNEMGVSAETVRQVEIRALKRLRMIAENGKLTCRA